ncbi:MAG: hypothetical protein ABIN04_04605 [Ginsengibacter sp.]
MDKEIVSIQNEHCSLTIERLGGSIVDFHLLQQDINPLNFTMPYQSELHDNYNFKGHFLCLGRWGDPSRGELAAGLNKHGEFLKLHWTADEEDGYLKMYASSKLEGLSVTRKAKLSDRSSCYQVVEKVRNENALGRMYQVVQHPTIAAPFLNAETIVDCNATLGFDYESEKYTSSIATLWPQVKTKNGLNLKLDKPDISCSSVFSFIVDPGAAYGWITAWSPVHHILLGYVWKRDDYPWINHWLHLENKNWDSSEANTANNAPGQLLYRGLEFGNTGVHKPFNEMLSQDLLNVLGEPTFNYIDAGEEHIRSFYSFMYALPSGFKGVQNISLNPEDIYIIEKETHNKIIIPHNFNQT